MSNTLVRVLAGVGFAALAAGLAVRLRLGLGRELVIATVRSIVQLAVVGAAIAAIFSVPALAFAFVAVMVVTAGLTAGSRLGALPSIRLWTLVAIGAPALAATGILLLVRAFATTPRAAVPTAGILIGGAMVASVIAGRRLIEALGDDGAEIEARLCLGDDARTALWPSVRRAIRAGLIPVIDQTRSVGLVTLPGTFVGLVLGGASAEQAAATQLVVLLALLAVELSAATLLCHLIMRAVIGPGESIVSLPAPSRAPHRR